MNLARKMFRTGIVTEPLPDVGADVIDILREIDARFETAVPPQPGDPTGRRGVVQRLRD